MCATWVRAPVARVVSIASCAFDHAQAAVARVGRIEPAPTADHRRQRVQLAARRVRFGRVLQAGREPDGPGIEARLELARHHRQLVRLRGRGDVPEREQSVSRTARASPR